NVDPPTDPKDYLHRGGRTARAGESGSVVTLVTPDQRRDMNRLMNAAGITPRIAQVRSGEEELSRITGAQAPSGVPVVIAAPPVERPRSASSSQRRRGRRGRAGQGRAGGDRSRRGRPAGVGPVRGSCESRKGVDSAARRLHSRARAPGCPCPPGPPPPARPTLPQEAQDDADSGAAP